MSIFKILILCINGILLGKLMGFLSYKKFSKFESFGIITAAFLLGMITLTAILRIE